MIKRIACIGVVVKDVVTTAHAYEEFLGMERVLDYELPDVGVKKGVALKLGNLLIELMEPSEKDTPVKKFLDTRGEGLFQIAVLSDDIRGEIEILKEKGARVSTMVIDKENDVVSGYISPKSTGGVIIEITGENVWPYNIIDLGP